MTRRLVVRPATRIELAEAADWYSAINPRLGDEFLRAFEAASAAITVNPLQYQVVYGNARRVQLARFSHSLIYTVSDDEIVIVSCFHGRRHPRRWQDRIQE